MKLIKVLFGTSEREERWAEKFSEWYGSVPSIKQQNIPILIWIVLAIVYPNLDPNLFRLGMLLTILSYSTQSILMLGNNRSAKKLAEQEAQRDKLLKTMKSNELKILKMEKELNEKLDRIEKKVDYGKDA